MIESGIKERIVKLRKASGMTQAQAAEAVGMRDRAWQNIEYGKTRMINKNIEKIAEVFGTTVDYIISGKEQTPAFLEDSVNEAYLKAKVDNLQQQLAECQATVDAKNDEISRLEKENGHLQIAVEALQGELALTRQNHDMERRLNDK